MLEVLRADLDKVKTGTSARIEGPTSEQNDANSEAMPQFHAMASAPRCEAQSPESGVRVWLPTSRAHGRAVPPDPLGGTLAMHEGDTAGASARLQQFAILGAAAADAAFRSIARATLDIDIDIDVGGGARQHGRRPRHVPHPLGVLETGDQRQRRGHGRGQRPEARGHGSVPRAHGLRHAVQQRALGRHCGQRPCLRLEVPGAAQEVLQRRACERGGQLRRRWRYQHRLRRVRRQDVRLHEMPFRHRVDASPKATPAVLGSQGRAGLVGDAEHCDAQRLVPEVAVVLRRIGHEHHARLVQRWQLVHASLQLQKHNPQRKGGLPTWPRPRVEDGQTNLPVGVELRVEPHGSTTGCHQPDARWPERIVIRDIQNEMEQPAHVRCARGAQQESMDCRSQVAVLADVSPRQRIHLEAAQLSQEAPQARRCRHPCRRLCRWRCTRRGRRGCRNQMPSRQGIPSDRVAFGGRGMERRNGCCHGARQNPPVRRQVGCVFETLANT
mmetsp:Transcript_28018/g.93097  ORF Transcript_28018/g.93097 Transcript_28018/m.93097 type:complete len:498 (-) Transcript_28018:2-1495(-)